MSDSRALQRIPFFAMAFPLCLALTLAASPAEARRLAVGIGKAYSKPSAASAIAQNGDTVDIDFGTYSGDACTWKADNLLLRGVPVAGSSAKYAHLDSKGAHSQGKGIWVIGGKNTTVENIEFSGAKVPDENGAGIRQEGPGVTIRNCYFHDNENGILADGGDMVIEYSEFNHNGLGEHGRTHNIYISSATSFTMRHCYSHHAVIGHNVKSRAKRNYILYNRIMDEADGTSSYDIDLPDGGFAVIMGNVLQQGPDTDNPSIISYGAESLKNAPNEVYLVNNTLVNDRQGGTFMDIAGGTTVSRVWNNLFVGPGNLVSGKLTDSGGNVSSSNPGLADRAGYDYRLTSASPAINKGKDAGSAGGEPLTPLFQYVHPFARQTRVINGAVDAGAYELGDGNPIRKRTGSLAHPDNVLRARISAKGGDAVYFFPGSEPDVIFDLLGKQAEFGPGQPLL